MKIKLRIVHVDDVGKNPTIEQIWLARQTGKQVTFAVELDPRDAEKVGLKPRQLLSLSVNRLDGGSPGAFIMTCLFLREYKQPVKVTGTFTPPTDLCQVGSRLGEMEMHIL